MYILSITTHQSTVIIKLYNIVRHENNYAEYRFYVNRALLLTGRVFMEFKRGKRNNNITRRVYTRIIIILIFDIYITRPLMKHGFLETFSSLYTRSERQYIIFVWTSYFISTLLFYS